MVYVTVRLHVCPADLPVGLQIVHASKVIRHGMHNDACSMPTCLCKAITACVRGADNAGLCLVALQLEHECGQVLPRQRDSAGQAFKRGRSSEYQSTSTIIWEAGQARPPGCMHQPTAPCNG